MPRNSVTGEWLPEAGQITDPLLRTERSYLFAPEGWDAAWKAAKALSGSTPAYMISIGDSITYGGSASDYMSNSWYALLRAALVTKYGLWGDFYSPVFSSDGAFAIGFNGTPPWTVSTTARTWFSQGFNQAPGYTGTPASPILTFVTPYACTALDLVFRDNQAGTFTYTLDGGSAQVITVTADQWHRKISHTGLANTVHTLIVTAQSGNYRATIPGIATYPGRTWGLGFANFGVSGSMARDWGKALGGAFDLCTVFQGRYLNTATGFGFPTQPSLATLSWGINETQNGTGVEQYKAVHRRLIQALRRGTPNCSIVLISNCNPDALSSDSVTPFIDSHNYRVFLEAQSSLAAEFNCAHVNFHAKWGETSYSAGLQNQHPTTAGHLDMANTLIPILV